MLMFIIVKEILSFNNYIALFLSSNFAIGKGRHCFFFRIPTAYLLFQISLKQMIVPMIGFHLKEEE